MSIQIKRVYEQAIPSDGYRVLVDRLWPRGLSKDHAEMDEWLREAAPSAALRQWFAHDPARWTEFRRRYFRELQAAAPAEAVARLRTLAARRQVTLLFAAQDEVHNNAAALREYLARPRRKRLEQVPPA